MSVCSHVRRLLIGAALLVAASAAQAQIMSGRINEGRDQRGANRVTPLTLDTNVATRPTFRSAVTRVEVSALVVDAQGRPVAGLEPGDFEVRDGGRPQKLTSFGSYSHAAAAIPLDTLGPDHRDAALGTNGWVAQSRLIALVIDDLHIDARYAERARTAARALIDRLAPSDLLLVALTSSAAESTAAFTRDRRRARTIVDGFGGMRLLDPMQEMRQLALQGPSSPGLSGSDQQRSMRLVDAYGTVERIASAARDATGRRKSLIFVTQGSPVGASGTATTVLTAEATGAMRNAIAAATAADVAIYPLDPAGLSTGTERMVEGFTRQVDDQNRDVAHEDLARLLTEFTQSRNQLRDLARLTGGTPLVDHNDATAAMDRVLRDASDYYLLSYEPDKKLTGSTLRTLEVRVKKPGLRVYARGGYLAPPARPDASSDGSTLAPAMQQLLGGVVPTDDLPLFVQVLPVERTAAGTRFAIVAEAAGPPLVAAIDDEVLAFQQAITSLDANGRMAPVQQKTAGLKIPSALAEAIARQGLRSIWTIDLPPGAHQIRVATLHPPSGRGGSLFLDVTVDPDAPVDPASLVTVTETPRPTAFLSPEAERLLQR